MFALATFVVGFLLGWIVTWMLQRRLDDNLHDEIAKLQRELNDCRRELNRPQDGPQFTVVEDADTAATRSPGAVALLTEEAVQEPAPQAEEGEVAATVVETVEDENVQRQTAAAEEMTETAIEETAIEETEEFITEEAADAELAAQEEAADTRVDASAAAAVAAAAAEESPEQVPEIEAPPVPDIATAPEREGEVANLTVIRGIGPKFAETLNAAGITSYAALAETSAERLQEIVQPAAWQKVDFEDWIAQASALSRQRRRLQIGDELTRLEGIGPAYAQRLRAAGITTFSQLAESDEETLAGIIDAPAWQRVHYGDWIAQAKLAAAGDEAGLKTLQDQLFSRQGDNLDLIEGIGDRSLAALTDAGITTYAQLAETTPEQLAEIMSAAGVRRANFDAWIEEAKQRASGRRVSRGGRTRSAPAGATTVACPQDLDEIDGIGDTYEQRLYNSGIGTFWEVGMLPQDELREILEIQDFQAVDLEAMQASAKSLAESTNTAGQVWDGTEPDDFEILEGIGPVYERRLYEAGICTFAAMAQLSEERLAEICQAPANFAPDYARWLEQAREAIA
jgi:predicted flap endonuclease-1-like 5' DNA nuclease